MRNEIKSILIEGLGYFYAEKQIDNEDPRGTYRIERNPIEVFTVNGEMAAINWYRQGDKEWNGKYVVQIEYYPNK